jgi:hypothetical protein
MKAFCWTNFILGVWLFIAGFALSHGSYAAGAEDIILGIIIACLAAIAAYRPAPATSWLVALAGLWTLIAPGVFHYGGAAQTNDVVIGIVVLVLGVSNAMYRRSLTHAHVRS